MHVCVLQSSQSNAEEVGFKFFVFFRQKRAKKKILSFFARQLAFRFDFAILEFVLRFDSYLHLPTLNR